MTRSAALGSLPIDKVNCHRFVVPLISCGLVESQVVPEVERSSGPDVRTIVNMIVPLARRHFAI